MDEDQDQMPNPAMFAEMLGSAMQKPPPTQWDYKQAALNWAVHWMHDENNGGLFHRLFARKTTPEELIDCAQSIERYLSAK